MTGRTVALLAVLATCGAHNYSFPRDFKFGVSTASYQIEGAWNYDGKGENIWDTMTHEHPEYIEDRSNGDMAANSYQKYKEDVQLIKQLGVQFYRFSISWARILPTGHINQVNKPGLDYYDNLINELIANGIEPMVSIFHWDLPQRLQDLGGLANRLLIDTYVDYARLLFAHYGDRVKWWITFNEPAIIATGYQKPNGFAPAVDTPGIGDYLVIHNMLLAHAKTYHMYNQEFRPSQGGNLGLAFNSEWYQPKTNSSEDQEAHRIAMQFYLGLHAHAIHSKEGDYPQLVKEAVASRSAEQGFLRSRLPEFSKEEVDFIRGTWDYFGLNHYTTHLVTPGKDNYKVPSLQDDHGLLMSFQPSWPATGGASRKVVPWGLRRLLNWIKQEYGNPTLLIIENGVADSGELNDTLRIMYHTSYLNEVLKAVVEDDCNVVAYSAWSYIDNFEWTSGYRQKFGLYHVDFEDPGRPRTPKQSAGVYADIIRTRQINPAYLFPEI